MLDPQVIAIIDQVSPAGIGPDGPLFDEATLRSLVGIDSVESKLLAIVRDKDGSPDRRFIAAEALIEGNWNSWRAQPENRRVVADVLADTLIGDRVHNRWGLPGEYIGRFGKQLLALDAEGDAALQRLLDDVRPLEIVGSEAATINRQSRYRIADLAAWLLASFHNEQWRNHSKPEVRDADIARLKERIS